MTENAFLQHTGVEIPLICGAMYPCSNAELVGAVAKAGAMAVVQPISLTFVHKHEFRAGLRTIKELSGGKPFGFNALIEASSQRYLERMRKWVGIALEEGVRFFVTALGNPRWVCDEVHAAGGVVYHDVTGRKHALKGLDGGVDGLICVNERAGGHAGTASARALYDELADLGVPLVCAGGIGSPQEFAEAIDLGFAACQLGTRFIATDECSAHPDYKAAIVKAQPHDIVLTDKISGVPVAVIQTEYVKKIGTKANFVMRRFLRHNRLKHYARMYYTLKSIWQLKRASQEGFGYKDYWQAGKSVGGIDSILPAATVVEQFAAALTTAPDPA